MNAKKNKYENDKSNNNNNNNNCKNNIENKKSLLNNYLDNNHDKIDDSKNNKKVDLSLEECNNKSNYFLKLDKTANKHLKTNQKISDQTNQYQRKYFFYYKIY